MTEDKHEHGSMDVKVHEKVFEGFMKWVVGVSVFSIAVLIFLAIFIAKLDLPEAVGPEIKIILD